ncbi:hypothetical protein EZS27_005362 [termite gut metagenome]|uniref:Uncharacterized protein n=1 Tax=termite gut metagenome TaxID=433724 RepID=A0A5J4SP87_9ZZZZ
MGLIINRMRDLGSKKYVFYVCFYIFKAKVLSIKDKKKCIFFCEKR